MPKLRAKAVEMVRQGDSIRQVAKYFGVHPSTVSRWNKKVGFWRRLEIPTVSSRPLSHPNQLSDEVVKQIVDVRKSTGRCAEVVHFILNKQGTKVSLSSVKRTLDRQGLIKKRSPYKRYHKPVKRPFVKSPGDLVQADTIHLMKNEKDRLYVYTLIDLFSRWAFARASVRMNVRQSLRFVSEAKKKFPCLIKCIQTDHGPEFSTHFSERIKIKHRHSRVRRPNDNAHLERFNLTLQKECLNDLPKSVNTINQKLPFYLDYYNSKRVHLGLHFLTPSQVLRSY